MSCTQQRLTQKTINKEFCESVTTEEESTNYVKKLTAIAVSSALYLRGVFDEKAYGLRKHDNLKLRILSERSDCEAATDIVTLIKGAFDAISKKYLKEMVFGIFTDQDKPDDLLEAYVFKYSYNETDKFNLSFNNREMTVSKTKNLANETKDLLKSMLTVVHSLNPLPEECYFTVKLYYYDDVTPEDYHPPGFQASRNSTTTVRGKPMAVNSGAVSTKYHSVKIKMKVDGFKEDSSESRESSCKSREIIEDNDSEKTDKKNSDNVEQKINSINDENVNISNETTGETSIKLDGTNGQTSKKPDGTNGQTSRKSNGTNGRNSKKSDGTNGERPKKKKKLLPELK